MHFCVQGLLAQKKETKSRPWNLGREDIILSSHCFWNTTRLRYYFKDVLYGGGEKKNVFFFLWIFFSEFAMSVKCR